jgi:hypothetical protein
MEHLPANDILLVLYQMLTESRGDPNAINLTDINAQHGTPSKGLMQVIGPTFARWHWPGTSFNIYDPLANIAAALNYASHGRGIGTGPGQLGSGHGYAEGGLVPGYASGGVAGPGAAYLRAWRTKHGGGYAAAWGPISVNQQIAAMTAAQHAAQVLSGASGLTGKQHAHYKAVAVGDARRLAVLHRELGIERQWRGQLGSSDTQLASFIAAAGHNPALAKNVTGWKTQIGRQKATIAGISKMLGYSDAQRAAIIKANPPAQTGVLAQHSYGGDVANNLGTVLAAALGPFTGAARGGLVSYDRGGWLKPGATMAWNGTGRPEQVVPARGGGGQAAKLELEITGGDQELVTLLRKIVKVKGGGDVQRALGAH